MNPGLESAGKILVDPDALDFHSGISLCILEIVKKKVI
jgi:hypothetical protein